MKWMARKKDEEGKNSRQNPHHLSINQSNNYKTHIEFSLLHFLHYRRSHRRIQVSIFSHCGLKTATTLLQNPTRIHLIQRKHTPIFNTHIHTQRETY